jgi:hypothetical protein
MCDVMQFLRDLGVAVRLFVEEFGRPGKKKEAAFEQLTSESLVKYQLAFKV